MRKAYQTDHRLKLTFASSAAGPQESRLRENLSNSGIDVVLLESGGEVYSQETQNLYSGKNIGRNYYELDACRLRYFGGTTNHWGGWCRRLRQIDFMERSLIPSSGWPIQLGDLIGWYEQAEAIVQLAQPDQSYGDTLNNYYKGIASFPFDPNRVVPEVYRFSPPTRFAEGFGRLLKKAQNVRVLLNANAVSVHNNQERTHVEGVRYETLAGQAGLVKASLFVLAAGGIENARLLLTWDLGNDHGLVGRFFMDHPEPTTGIFVAIDQSDRRWLPLVSEHPGLPNPLAPYVCLSLPESVLEREAIVNSEVGLLYMPPVSPEGYSALRRLVSLEHEDGLSLGELGRDIALLAGDIAGLGSAASRALAWIADRAAL